MQIQLDNGDHSIQLEAYQVDKIQINKNSYRLPVLITPESIKHDHPFESFDSLAEDNLKLLHEFDAEVIIMGTGPSSRFLKPEVEAYCYQSNLIIDTMPTDAACRTFMLLAAEKRRVVALLF